MQEFCLEEAGEGNEDEDGNNNSLSEDFGFDAYEAVPGQQKEILSMQY